MTDTHWAKMPREIIESALDLHCKMLYALIDSYQMGGDRGFDGYTRAAKKLGVRVETISKHAGHLAAVGLIRLEAEGNGKKTMTIERNVARGRDAGEAPPSATPIERPKRLPPAERSRATAHPPAQQDGVADSDTGPAHQATEPPPVRREGGDTRPRLRVLDGGRLPRPARPECDRPVAQDRPSAAAGGGSTVLAGMGGGVASSPTAPRERGAQCSCHGCTDPPVEEVGPIPYCEGHAPF